MEHALKRYLSCSFVLLVSAACSQDAAGPTAPSIELTGASTVAAPEVPQNFRAHLSGREVAPALPVETLAQGQAVLQLSPDGTGLSYHVIASNIDNVVSAHVHLGTDGVRGPLVALLIGGFQPKAGRTDGVLSDGTLVSTNLFGPLLNHPLSDLIDAMRAGNVYVDIPTNDGVPPGGTGPGDYPGGELRGQLH